MSAPPLLVTSSQRSALIGGVAYLVLFLGVHVVLATAPDGLTVPDVVELVLIGAPAAVISLPRRIGAPIAFGCVLSLVTAATVSTFSLPPVAQGPDYRSWALGAVTFVALGLAFRGRYVEAWLTLACIAGVTIGWSVAMGLGPLVGGGLVVRHFGTLLAGSLISVALARSARSAAAFEAVDRQEREATEAARARHLARQAAAQAVLDQAEPLLEQLADGHALSEADRLELLVLEGSLRDRIRAPELLQDGLRHAVAAARRRGIDVLLLDEAGPAADQGRRFLAAEWLTSELEAAGGRRFVGRLVSRDGVARVTAVSDLGSHALTLPAPEPATDRAGRGANHGTPTRGSR
jgi:hypothetical protein